MRRRIGRSAAGAAALACAGVVAAAAAPEAGARSIVVRSAAQFASAVDALRSSGGTIVVAPGRYRTFVVGPRSSRPLRVVGKTGARAERVLLDRTQRVTIERLTIAPRSGPAWLTVSSSAHVVLDRLLVTARGTRYSASVELPGSRDVTIRRSRFNHCGDRSVAWAFCLLPRVGSSRVVVEDSVFHDCLGCDFIHGRFDSDLTIRRNRFDRALPCRIAPVRCGHQDLIELFTGRGLRVEANRFGVYSRGGAQLYISNGVDDVEVTNNVFLGRDARAPGHRPLRAIVVGTRVSKRVPLNVRIVNNTILSGRPSSVNAGSIKSTDHYSRVPRSQRPLIANNVVKLLAPSHAICRSARATVRNVILSGRPCSASDRVGDPRLDAEGRPTADSALVIDRASPLYAPRTDVLGRPRGRGRSGPDIGAYEYVPR